MLLRRIVSNKARRRGRAGQKSFSRMLGPWLQPPIHLNTRSPTDLASSDPVIELVVLPSVPYSELGVAVEQLGGA